MLLADIGVVDSLPASIAKSYATDLTIGVDVGQEHTTIHQCGSALDVMARMQDLGEILLRRHVLEIADLVIRPGRTEREKASSVCSTIWPAKG